MKGTITSGIVGKALILILIAVISISCSQNAEPRFYVDIERDFDVDTTLNGVVTHFFQLKNVPTKIDQNLDLYGLDKEGITTISPADAVLTTSTGLMDWSLVNWVEIYAVSRTDSKLRKQIFYVRERDPNNNDEVRLFNTFADLSDIMVDETIDLEVRFTTIVGVPGYFTGKLLFNYAVFDEL